MLGTEGDADDAVQEAWFRLTRAGDERIDNLGGWLTTVVARVSLDMLRARGRHHDATDRYEARSEAPPSGGPEYEALLADSVGAALIIVLETLTPGERLAFVLHDMFDVPFDDISSILGRSTAATKMLASRARHKVHGSPHPASETDRLRQREVVDAFLAASRHGQFDTLVTLLHPDVVLAADTAAVTMGSPDELRGPEAVAGMFSGRALAAQAALIDGAVGVVWAVAGRPKVAWDLIIEDGKIIHIDMLAATATLDGLELEILES
jgi:RNA polymerase sigma-70 factor (ECF subfamily)